MAKKLAQKLGIEFQYQAIIHPTQKKPHLWVKGPPLQQEGAQQSREAVAVERGWGEEDPPSLLPLVQTGATSRQPSHPEI